MATDWEALKKQSDAEVAGGYETSYKLPLNEDGVTPPLKFVSVEVELVPKFPDPKKRTMLNFKMLNSENGQTIDCNKAIGTRFFNAFEDVKPQEGDFIQIKKEGEAFKTQYFIKKVDAVEIPVWVPEVPEATAGEVAAPAASAEKTEEISPENIPF